MSRDFDILPQSFVIRDTYTVENVIGEGAFGVVYKVRHKFLGIQALKIFHTEKLPLNSQNQILTEAFILSKITHPNVVRVFDANHFDWQGQKISYVAMEYVAGGTLETYLRTRGKISFDLAVKIQMMICRGLAQAHQLQPPVIHRDVKPQNIMVDHKGQDIVVKVSDFGQAKYVDPMTMLTDSAGTLAYMAPEGFWNYKSPASDVYSAGIIFYMMLTGVPPFKIPDANKYKDEREVERMIRKARTILPELPSCLCPGLDIRWDTIVMKSIESDSANRYKDAAEFLQALDLALPSESDALSQKIKYVLTLGRQYRDLPQAIEAMESILREVSEKEKKKLMTRYGKILESWKKGIIL